jgi:hypothetical protein
MQQLSQGNWCGIYIYIYIYIYINIYMLKQHLENISRKIKRCLKALTHILGQINCFVKAVVELKAASCY